MRYIIKLINLLFILTIPFIFISLTLALIINIPAFYEYEFNRYNVGHATIGDFANLDSRELKLIARSIPSYFNSGGADEPIRVTVRGKELFNEKEKVHMVDVKKLVRLDYGILLVLLSFIACCTAAKAIFFSKSGWKRFFGRLLWGAAITLGLVFALGLVLVFNFQGFFLAFHLVSFTNLFWMLDYTKDNLINLFPSGLFFDAALIIAIAVIIESAILLAISIYWKQGKL